jgi:hypothetical protein
MERRNRPHPGQPASGFVVKLQALPEGEVARSHRGVRLRTARRARALYLSKSRHRVISFQTSGYEVGGQRTLIRSVRPYTAPDPEGTPAPSQSNPGPATKR